LILSTSDQGYADILDLRVYYEHTFGSREFLGGFKESIASLLEGQGVKGDFASPF
jgi:hypothetical protein